MTLPSSVEMAFDGFILDPSEPGYSIQRDLTSWLEAGQSHRLPPALLFHHDPQLWGDWVGPAFRRFLWIARNRDLLPGAVDILPRIGLLVGRLLNRVSAFGPPLADALLTALAKDLQRLETVVAGNTLHRNVLALCERRLRSEPWPGELSAALRSLLDSAPPESYDGSAAARRVAWHLFQHRASHPSDARQLLSEWLVAPANSQSRTQQQRWHSLWRLAPGAEAAGQKWEARAKAAAERIGSTAFQSHFERCANEVSGALVLDYAAQLLLRLCLAVDAVAPGPALRRFLTALPDVQWNDARSMHLFQQLRPFWTPHSISPAPVPQPSGPYETHAGSTDDLQSHPPAEVETLARRTAAGDWAAYAHVEQYTMQHGYQAELVKAVQQFERSLSGTIADQTKREHVSWWLWRETVLPVQTKDCWSSVIRADLRTLPAAWRALFDHVSFAKVAKPPAKWSKANHPAFAAVGDQPFRERVWRWTAPFRATDPLVLSPAGGNALRQMIWLCSFCSPDPQLDDALVSIVKATWRTKQARERAKRGHGPLVEVLRPRSPEHAWQMLDHLAATEAFASTHREAQQYQELSAQLGRPARTCPAPPVHTPPSSTERLQQTLQILKHLPGSGQIEVGVDSLVVRGRLDTYRLSFNGAIHRRSGAPVRIHVDALPAAIRPLLGSVIDFFDLVSGDPAQPNPAYLIALCRVLSDDEYYQAAIQ